MLPYFSSIIHQTLLPSDCMQTLISVFMFEKLYRCKYSESCTPEGACCPATRSFNLPRLLAAGVPDVFQPCLLTSQRPGLKQGLFASLWRTFSGILWFVGEGFVSHSYNWSHSLKSIGLNCVD